MDKPIERRYLALTAVEYRGDANGDTAKFVGYAARTGAAHATDIADFLGKYREQIAPGAFKRAIAEGQTVPLLVNHDSSAVPLARFPGTLTLTEDAKGLRAEATLDLRSPDAKSVAVALERRDLRAMSFAFRATAEDWSSDYSSRTVRDLDLYDVAIVTSPAYPTTEAGLRDNAEARSHAILAANANRSGKVLSGANLALVIKAKEAVDQAAGHLGELHNAAMAGDQGLDGGSGPNGAGDDSNADGLGVRERRARELDLLRLDATPGQKAAKALRQRLDIVAAVQAEHDRSKAPKRAKPDTSVIGHLREVRERVERRRRAAAR